MGNVVITFYGGLAKIVGEKTTDVEASTLKDAIDSLILRHGEEFKNGIYDEKGNVRRFINIYVNGKDIRFLKRLDTPLNNEDKISIIPAAGGG